MDVPTFLPLASKMNRSFVIVSKLSVAVASSWSGLQGEVGGLAHHLEAVDHDPLAQLLLGHWPTVCHNESM